MKAFLKSFTYAFKGIFLAFPGERNIKVHYLATILAVSAGFYFQISPVEWLVVILLCFLVIILEMINTAIETLVDEVSLEKRPGLGKVKDIAAGAVLMGAICAVICGGIIFFPRIADKWF